MDTTSTQILNEIDRRVADLREQAAQAGETVLAPLLMLGTSERVGSNWLSDTLRTVMTPHNEPFRQQMGALHPLSALNPYPVEPEHASTALLGPLGWHGLVQAVLAKHAPQRHMIKETNLFFTAPALLRLFAASPVVVLSRSPLGVASSFARSDLFTQWEYSDRYQQMVTMTTTGTRTRPAGLVPDDEPDELTALTRLVVLNAVLLSDALGRRAHSRVGYEAAVLDRRRALAALENLAPVPPDAADGRAEGGQGVFATTTSKTNLVAHLSVAQAAQVVDVTAASLEAAGEVLPQHVVSRAREWLAGAEHYEIAGPARTAPARTTPVSAGTGQVDVEYVHAGQIAWRNKLVSNAEFCGFLNAVHAAGLANTQRGTHLMLAPMPHERGGRVRWSPEQEAWTVSPGWENHPVYWVTWIGAAAFAAVNSARLPTHAEAVTLATSGTASNHDYAHGDVLPAVQETPWQGIHHAVGNLQIWCGDGPQPQFGQPVQRWMHGAAWNTPADEKELGMRLSRHLLGSSRSVGIRLVRDKPFTGPTVAEVAQRLSAWIDGLSDRARTMTDLDGQVASALQADVGLGSLV